MSEIIYTIQRHLKGKGHDLGTSGPAGDGVDGKLGKDLEKSITLQAVVTELGVVLSAPSPADHQNEANGLGRPDKFYDHLRRTHLLGPTLTQSEVGGCNAILNAVADADWPLSWAAYALATAYHETAGTMQPIKEYGGSSYLTRNYDVMGANAARAKKHGNVNPGDGVRYCGRGYVQLTWQCNYKRAGQALDLDLIQDPAAALRADVAAKIMVRGMAEGWFCNKSCLDYLPTSGAASLPQFREARRIINGVDKAAKIAQYAVQFQEALVQGHWD